MKIIHMLKLLAFQKMVDCHAMFFTVEVFSIDVEDPECWAEAITSVPEYYECYMRHKRIFWGKYLELIFWKILPETTREADFKKSIRIYYKEFGTEDFLYPRVEFSPKSQKCTDLEQRWEKQKSFEIDLIYKDEYVVELKTRYMMSTMFVVVKEEEVYQLARYLLLLGKREGLLIYYSPIGININYLEMKEGSFSKNEERDCYIIDRNHLKLVPVPENSEGVITAPALRELCRTLHATHSH